MTATTRNQPARDQPKPVAAVVPERWEAPRGPAWVLRDTWTEAQRHLRIVPRTTDLMFFSIVQPIMFVLLFIYVFGGSISIPGYDDYKQYLLPGIFTQTVIFGTSFTGLGIANDMQKGLIERLRSLPMSQPAVLIGRTVSDLIRNTVTFAVMLIVAFIVGFRFEGSLVSALGASVLLLGFSYGFSWIQALIGLSVSTIETVESAGFMWMFPLTFVSSAFVDPATFPAPLRWFAEYNPFTAATNATRALYNGREAGSDLSLAVLWAIGITLVFGSLAVRRFAKANRS